MRIGSLICIPMAGLLLLSCNSNSNTKTADTKKTPVTAVVEKDMVLEKYYVADIQAVQNVELRSRIQGFLEAIHVDEGMRVKKGQLLFTIGDEEYRADLSRAKASLNSSKAEALTVELELERVRMLVNKKILSPTELEVAKAKLSVARARVEEAKSAVSHAAAKLSYTHIYAPFDGVIDRIPLKVGSLLEEGTLVTSVSDISAVYAYFNISENEYLTYIRNLGKDTDTSGKSIKLILSDGHEYKQPGKVETVVSEFEDNTGSIAFRARFSNPDGLLKHGASGKVKLSNKVSDALVVPQKATFEIQDRNYVFIVDKDNKVAMRNFKPKERHDNLYIVESGLKAGETIVFEGIQNIKDGMQVTPSFTEMDKLAKDKML